MSLLIQWIRGFNAFSFNKANIITSTGIRGSGKSALAEVFGELYLEEGHSVLDLFGARDAEGLAILRSQYANELKFLLLHGENVEVVSAPCEAKPASEIDSNDLKKYDVIISVSPLYSNSSDEFLQIGHLMDRIFYRRLHWKRLIYCIVREAANLYYSRIKATDSQHQAKSSMVYLIRQSRHVGLALGMDTLRVHSIDVDIRSLTDYLFIKSVGFYGLHPDLRWLYSIFRPDKLQKMPPSKFIALTQEGDIGVGHFELPPWHKLEHENIMDIVGVKVEYKEPVRSGADRGTYKTIGDKEHVEIMRMYADEGLSYIRIGDALGRSSRTAHEAVKRHNRLVESNGFCPICRRVGGDYEKRFVKKKSMNHRKNDEVSA